MNIKAIKALLILLFISASMAQAQKVYELNKGWKCMRAGDVHKNGTEISKPGFSLAAWQSALVPGTVLTSLLQNQSIPDPFYGMNNEQIPDIYKTGRDYYTYWFASDFREQARAGEQVYMTFRGINYSADIYLNGQKINTRKAEGMFLRHSYNITPFIAGNGQNRLAVIVYPPDPVGNPNGGQGGDGVIARSLTNQYPAGWDWIQPVRDRNTGIWDKVFIEKTGAVTVRNTHVITTLSLRNDTAYIHITTELTNTGTLQDVPGYLHFRLTPPGSEAIADQSVRVPLRRGETRIYALPVIKIPNPLLWWPNGYGTQPLYDIAVSFTPINKKMSDMETVQFGIRELKAVWDSHTQSRALYVNARRIFIKGGNRILSDAMLRFSPERYDAEIRYHRDMNLNLIRVWGGGITERPEFYDACDRYGLLVMQDFWVSGDCNGRWYDPLKIDDTTARRKYPDDHKLFVAACADQVKMLRNHPSLAYWCGGNEIKPPADILIPLRDSILPLLDGTRYFFEYSNDDSMSLAAHDGPYTIQRDNYFWEHRSWGFNSEIGSVGIGDMESLERFIPKDNLVPPVYDAASGKWKADSVWQYHKYYSYDSSIEKYGHPKDIADFAMKAQLVNYTQYRSLIESFAARMWDWYTGVIIWKTQNPWTAMVGQMYDVYLDPNACLYGLAEGAKPTHISYDLANKQVLITNTDTGADSFRAVIKTIDINGAQKVIYRSGLLRDSIKVDVPYVCHNLSTSLSDAIYADGYFLDLHLSYMRHGVHEVDDNLYWMPGKDGNYSMLQRLNKASINVSAVSLSQDSIMVRIANGKGGSIAFFNRVSLIDNKTKKRILPVFSNNNYISILPGGSQVITLAYRHEDGIVPQVCIEGWNVDKQYIDIKKK